MIDPAVERYAEQHTTPRSAQMGSVVETTAAETAAPQMMTGLLESRLLEALVVAGGATRALELGTFTGHGSLAIAAALPEDGRLVTIESDAESAAIARRSFDRSPVGHKVELVVGDARKEVEAVAGPLDLVFIDAWKADYVHYYESVLPKLAPRGVIVADNVLWSGLVADPGADDDRTAALRAFNERVQVDDRVRNVLLTVGDGLMLVWHAG